MKDRKIASLHDLLDDMNCHESNNSEHDHAKRLKIQLAKSDSRFDLLAGRPTVSAVEYICLASFARMRDITTGDDNFLHAPARAASSEHIHKSRPRSRDFSERPFQNLIFQVPVESRLNWNLLLASIAVHFHEE